MGALGWGGQAWRESEQVQGGPGRQAWGSQPPPDCSLLPKASSVCIEVRRSITSHIEGLSNTGRMHLLPIQKVLSQQSDVQTSGICYNYASFLINRLAVRG